MNIKQHLESKTNGPLLLLLIAIIGLAIAGKLTAEAVDALKWLGTSFFSVRAAVNVMERLPGNQADAAPPPPESK